MNIALALHGGAGTLLRSNITPEQEAAHLAGLQAALSAGWDVLQGGGAALDAVTATVQALENNPLFNAGRGSVFTHEGTHEMDASIMSGRTRDAGSVSSVRNVRNPILLARAVMERSEHLYLSGAGAGAFARENGIDVEPDEYFYDEHRHRQFLEACAGDRVQLDHAGDRKFGTVGAAALDSSGDLAAATSTGGMTNKRYGRVGDSPIIGSGTYANNRTCAVSCTGHGEYFIRSVVAHDISCLMDYAGMTLSDACDLVVNGKLREMGGEGGLVAVDGAGNIAMPFNTEGMYRGSVSSSQAAEIRIF